MKTTDPIPRCLLTSLQACRNDYEPCRCGGFPMSAIKLRAGVPALDEEFFWDAIDALHAEGLVKFCGMDALDPLSQHSLSCYCLSSND